MKSKEMFNSLRVTTMEVASPLIHLAAHRGKMIKKFIEFAQSLEATPELVKLIQEYNEYAKRDQEIVDVAKGVVSEELL